MAEIIRMPRLSDTMEEGNIVSWLKKVGDTVKSGDILAEVETDKATMELESYFNGTLLYISKENGTVPVDGIIAIIGDKSEKVEEILAASGNNGVNTTSNSASVEPIQSKPTPELDVPSVSATTHSDSRLKISPLAKSLAKEASIDFSQISGSGDQGRIIKKDIENLILQQKTSSVDAPKDLVTFTYGDVPVTQMRKVIAKRLGESKFSAPHFYLTIEINMDNAIQARQTINEVSDIKISFNDLIIKLCALALKKHPAINSSWFGDKITYHKDINIGVAVAVEDGLLVPVVFAADQKSLTAINTEVKSLANKAKNKKLAPQEMQGNTFTISNLGMFDIDEFTAIINPPDACILAVSSIVKKPVIKNDQIVIGNVMKVTLSCDHRVVDGVTGAKFLQTFKQYLENPILILL
ncbi:MAG: pyruvate dehydrogenase complex dihydrolipoamide acetyltransferase [Saprospiraceae bacterium]